MANATSAFQLDPEIEKLLRGDPSLGGTASPPAIAPAPAPAPEEGQVPAVLEPAVAPVSPEPQATSLIAQPLQAQVAPIDLFPSWETANGDITVKIRESQKKREQYASIAHVARNTPELVLGAPVRFARDFTMSTGEHLLEAEGAKQALVASGFRLAEDVLHDTFIGKIAGAEANRRQILADQATGAMQDSVEYREEKREELFDKVDPEKDGLTFGEEVLLSASDSLVASTAAITSAYITKGGANAAALIMGVHSGLMESGEQRAAKSGAINRVAGSLVNAAAEYGFERWSFGALLGKDAASKTLVRKFGEFIAREVPSELATTAVQYAAEAATRNPDANLSELWHQLAVTAVATPLSGGGQVAIYEGTRPAIKAVDKLLFGEEVKGTVLPEEFHVRSQDVATAQGAFTQAAETEQKLRDAIHAANESILSESGLEEDEIDDRAEAVNAAFSGYNVLISPLESVIRPGVVSVESQTSVTPFVPDEVGFAKVIVLEHPNTQRIARSPVNPEEDITADYIQDAKRISHINRRGMQQAKKWIESMFARLDPKQDTYPSILLNVALGEDYKGMASPLQTKEGNNFTDIQIAEDLFDSNGNLTREGYHTLAHEFGHSLFEGQVQSLTREQKNMLAQEWQNKVIANAHKPLKDVLEDFFSPARRKILREVINKIGDPNINLGDFIDYSMGATRQDALDVEYYFGPTEYFAEQVSVWAQTSKAPVTEAEKVFSEIAGTMKKYQKAMTTVFGEPTTMDSIIKMLELRPRIDLAYERLQMAKQRYKEYMEELKKNPPEEVLVDRVGGILRRAGKRTNNTLDASKAQRDLIKFNAFLRHTQGIINIFEANPSIPRFYRDTSVRFNSFKNEITVEANQVVDEWLNTLNTKENAALEAFLFEADRQSSLKKRKLKKAELAQIAKDLDIAMTPKIERMATLIWAKFNDALTRMEEALLSDINSSFDLGNPLQAMEAEKQIAKTKREFKQLRNRNYMPHSRFGRYWVWFKAPNDGFKFEGTTYNEGQTVIASAFEHESEMREEADRLRKLAQGTNANIITEELNDEVSVFAGMPETLMERMLSKTFAVSGLTEEQKEEIRRKVSELRVEVGSAQSFKKKLIKRKNVKGYSTSGMRVFSEYFWRFSNHMARLKFGADFEEGIRQLQEYKGTLTGDQRFKMSQIENYVKRHREYLFNPGNEMAGLRSMLFHWFLGFSLKAAVVNFTQVPLVLYPYLSTRYGDVDTSAELATAFADVGKFWKRGRQFTAEEQEVIEEMTRRGILHESNASVLAASAGEELFSGRLKRLTANSEINRMGTLMMQKAGRASPFMFQQIEILNRYVTLLSSYRLSRKAGRSHEEALEEVYHAMYMTQYEYARFNRPEIMRGKKGAFFTFWQYLTNTLFFVYDDPARWRYLLMLLFAGGASGLPFASNIMDLLSAVGTQANKALVRMGFKSKGEMLVELERDTEEFLNELLDNPWVENPGELTMYGASRALSPFDLYYSISMGRILPTEFMTQTNRSANDAIGGALRESSAAGSLVYNMIQAMNDTKDAQYFRAMERMMPTAARNLTRAYRNQTEGVERDASGYTVYEFKPESVEDRFMIAGQALSFTSKKIAEIKRDRYAARDAIAFYQGFQSTLLAGYWKATVKGDTEQQKDILAAIEAYNKSVPWPEMRISASTLKDSMRQRFQQDQLYQNQLYSQRKYNRLYRDYVGEE